MSTGTKYPSSNPEIWGGIECTINRISDNYRDQLDYAGHYLRADDINKIAKLGIKRIRYPVLWEFHQKEEITPIDWSWTTIQLQKLRDHKIEPIAGLVHHGSGPSYTSLLDDQFAEKLAAYAGKVAHQFPWLTNYTPVNEPLTTARFSGLYGFWYPHHSTDTSFVKMLLNQVKGIVLSMQAIRKHNPGAKLVQTEDLCKIHSTPALAYQAYYENHRRWLTYDLLCGLVNSSHFFWKRLLDLGIKEKELLFFIENPCPPDIMGFNYYVTSERYLDEKLDRYPQHTHGSNGRDSYADTEAVRSGHALGVGPLLTEAWNRYKIPLAITECHLSCTREEQLRWLNETWQTACELKSTGIDIVAVTPWALLGSYDWNSVLVKNQRHYETGVFDIRSGELRATLLAPMIRSLSATGKFDHPLLTSDGWWRLPETVNTNTEPPPLLILGRNGTLGKAFARICEQRKISYITLSRQDVDIRNAEKIRASLRTYRPWAVINATGYVNVDEAEFNRNECFAINATGPCLLASICNEMDIPFMTFSSDLVFSGDKRSPYGEADPVKPINIYGESKAEGERLILSNNSDALVIRTSAFFGPWDRYNFVHHVIETLANNKVFYATDDVSISPTYVPDLASAALDIFIDGEKGIWHISNDGILTWSEFAKQVASRGGYNNRAIITLPQSEMGWKAKRPGYSALTSEKGIKLPSLESALDRYFLND